MVRRVLLGRSIIIVNEDVVVNFLFQLGDSEISSLTWHTTSIIFEYKLNHTLDDPPDDLTLVIFGPHDEMGGGLPLEKTSATSWLFDGVVAM